jgi:alcohol dehydrogenase class IV
MSRIFINTTATAANLATFQAILYTVITAAQHDKWDWEDLECTPEDQLSYPEVFYGLPQSLQANAGTVPSIQP